MVKLNLLPPQEKKEIELNKISYWLTFFWASLLVLAVIFTLLCFSSYIHLSILINAQEKQLEIASSDIKGQELEKIETEISEANLQINKIQQLQNNFFCWTPILEEVSDLVSHGIYLENLIFKAKTAEVKLSGHADLREEVIEFSEEIGNHTLFEEFTPPLSNLINKEDVNFTFDFKINTSTASCHFEN